MDAVMFEWDEEKRETNDAKRGVDILAVRVISHRKEIRHYVENA